MKIKVQAEPFDAGAEIAALHNGNPAIGAVTSFTGYCRDEGGELAALELEHFPGMAESQLTGNRRTGEPALAVTRHHHHSSLWQAETR
jgi:molybdopterin synthase catalytic subunit